MNLKLLNTQVARDRFYAAQQRNFSRCRCTVGFRGSEKSDVSWSRPSFVFQSAVDISITFSFSNLTADDDDNSRHGSMVESTAIGQNQMLFNDEGVEKVRRFQL